jgi:hypothetical protein
LEVRGLSHDRKWHDDDLSTLVRSLYLQQLHRQRVEPDAAAAAAGNSAGAAAHSHAYTAATTTTTTAATTAIATAAAAAAAAVVVVVVVVDPRRCCLFALQATGHSSITLLLCLPHRFRCRERVVYVRKEREICALKTHALLLRLLTSETRNGAT